MAAQAALIQGTIAGMKQALARYQDSSDSDEPYLQSSNRGNKLKRKGCSIQDGDLSRPRRLKVYKRSIEHAGYQRPILRRNPKRYDEDGDELADSDVDEDADARAAEENPYADIHLENLLIPLVTPARLPTHPSMSIAYSSPILTNMAQHAREMLQRERRTLACAKRMMTRLRGDQTWVPCELMYTEKDEAIFNTESVYHRLTSKGPIPRTNGVAARVSVTENTTTANSLGPRGYSQSQLGLQGEWSANGLEKVFGMEDSNPEVEKNDEEPNAQDLVQAAMDETEAGETIVEADTEMVGGSSPKTAHTENISKISDAQQSGNNAMPTANEHPPGTDRQSGVAEAVNGDTITHSPQDGENLERIHESTLAGEDVSMHQPENDDAEERAEDLKEGIEGDDESQPEPRRMRTRAQAQAASEPRATSRTGSPDAWVCPEIHALFQIPKLAIPDRDFGLPAEEADETRRLLTMYVQKQEEVCRGAERLYEGLLRADRQRNTVYKWCKADGHVGEMSDGEDWYDKEEWGLDEDLEKGHCDEEGDNNAIQGRKPRRRA